MMAWITGSGCLIVVMGVLAVLGKGNTASTSPSAGWGAIAMGRASSCTGDPSSSACRTEFR